MQAWSSASSVRIDNTRGRHPPPPASSEGRRNTCAQFTRWSLEAQSFSRALIETQRDPVQLRLRVAGKVSSLRQVLSQQTVGVFVGSSLPGAVRIAEVDFHICGYREGFVFGHLQSAIPGQRATQRCGKPANLPAQCGDDRSRVFAAHLDQGRKTRMPFHQRRDVTVFCAPNEIAFPMTGNGAVFDFRGSFPDGDGIYDLAARVFIDTRVLRAADAALGSQMPQQLFLQHSAGLDEQTAVNRFVGHAHALVRGILDLQPSGNLFRRPVQNQFTRNHLPQLHVDGQKATFGPQGRVPGSLIRFIGSILRTAAMACDFSLTVDAARSRALAISRSDEPEAIPREMSSRSTTVSASTARRRTDGTIPPCCDKKP